MLFMYFISEIMLWVVTNPQNRPLLVQSGILVHIVKLKDIISDFISLENKTVGKLLKCDVHHNFNIYS